MVSGWRSLVLVVTVWSTAAAPATAQRAAGQQPKEPLPAAAATSVRLNGELLAGLALRNIGPALTSGRVADLAIDPRHRSTWYVAVGSGGVWKTVNSGTTWTPIFDQQGSYSIGALALDPQDPLVVWVGTGENVSGRHVGYGDGVYRSRDGGASFERMGLAESEHIAKIVVDPRDSNVVWVAAEGPLWSSGGERGIFRTGDGGATWTASLVVSPDTGFADLEQDPEHPDTLYAAAYQRRRHVWAHLAGGAESGIYKTTDGGATWRRLERGLPEGAMGKIGLAVSPQRPAVVYATIEAEEKERGFYRSQDGGESWEKRSDYTSGGTGPHYYQEIYASPHRFDVVYQMDVFMRITEDGGKTFRLLGEPDKHSDNHALAFAAADPDYLLAGCDGGVYETFDHGRSWRFVANLPVTQIYKLAVDNDTPFYNVSGGTQDNGTQYGPARTTREHGIMNRDWKVAYSADGYATAIDPTDANVAYLSWQQGHPLRYDRRTGETIDIQPQPKPGDPPDRWNWDAPILISPHQPARLYYGSQRLWRSDDRGDSWTAVSGDLTSGLPRFDQPFFGRQQGAAALWGNSAMSWYANLTAIDESPLQAGLLWVGTDDGLVQVSEDGGASWRKVERLPGVPEWSFVNEVRASRHAADTAFVVLDNHKQGDYAPYLLVTRDRGRTWSSLRGDLPDRHLVWSLVEDHANPKLLFAGTELGLFLTVDGGAHWLELSGGVPTIAFRDLEIQRRENDLVAASFGRGFFVLDDYAALRTIDEQALQQEGILFPVRRTPWYVPEVVLTNPGKGSSGSDLYAAPNPPFGALLTYYLRDDLESSRAQRQRGESLRAKARLDVPFAGVDTLREEELELAPRMLVVVRDPAGNLVRRLEAETKKGLHRIAWDLRLAPTTPIRLEPPRDLPPWMQPPQGPLAPPGRYRVALVRLVAGVETLLGEQELEVYAAPTGGPSGTGPRDAFTFQLETAELLRTALGAAAELSRAQERLRHLEAAWLAAPRVTGEQREAIARVRRALHDLEITLVGDPLAEQWEEPSTPSIVARIQQIVDGHWGTRYGPTKTHRESLATARVLYEKAGADLRRTIEEELAALEQAFEAAGAPHTPGRALVRP